jgi:hypothetical protein
VRNLKTVGGPVDDHEIQLAPNGNYVMGLYVPRDGVDLSTCGGPDDATIVDNEFQELTPDGALAWSWIALDHIPVEEANWPNVCTSTSHDLYHFNSIEPDGDAYIISFRHLNALYKVSRSSGKILWKLGGTPRAESLSVIGDPELAAGGALFGGQHDARRLPDGTLSVHDNRTGQTNPIPRALRFRLDEVAMTATLIEAMSDPDVELSRCCGSARKLRTGNWVTAWGANPEATELTADGDLVFRINFEGLFTHRAVPIMPGRLSRLALRNGMNAQYPRVSTALTIDADGGVDIRTE